MKKLSILLFVIIAFLGCKKAKLDALAFPSAQLDAYEFEEYDAGDAAVPAEYAVDTSNRTLVSMTSTDQNTGDTYTIYGVYIGDMSTISEDTVIMYCHGQSLHMDAYWPRATLLASLVNQHHYGVFMMDYRGYGMSEGTASEQGLYEDVDASIDWLIDQGAQPEKTFYYGFSLGCIPVIDRAAFRTDFIPNKIIIESPLASVAHLAQSSLILNINPSYVSTLEFDNAEKMKSVNIPLLWYHGEEDDYIAIENGEIIYNNHSGTFKESKRVPVAGHGNIPATIGYADYIKQLEDFIRQEY
jgi:pimeloyl-ACP methyl ester carboxylesterase